VVLKPGWLNRQFDQVSKNVEAWPEWMKRAAGVQEEGGDSHLDKPEPVNAQSPQPRRGVQASHQQRLL
jgi:hypothetical protein